VSLISRLESNKQQQNESSDERANTPKRMMLPGRYNEAKMLYKLQRDGVWDGGRCTLISHTVLSRLAYKTVKIRM